MNLRAPAALSIGFALLAACGGKVVVDHAGAGGGGGGTGDGGSGNFSSSDSATTGPPTVTVGPTTAITSVGPSQVSSGTGNFDCSDRRDFPACAECCINENPDGYESLVAIYVAHCGCAPDAPCLPACDTNDPNDLCRTGDFGGNFRCTECLNGLDPMEQCVTDYYDECLQDRSCTAVLDCFGQCPS